MPIPGAEPRRRIAEDFQRLWVWGSMTFEDHAAGVLRRRLNFPSIQSVQKKTSTMSLTISSSSSSSSSAAVSSRELSSSSSHCSSSSSGFLNQRHSNLLQTLPVGSETAQTPLSGQPYSANGVAPTFVKCLHDVSTLKGQLVVLECRMRGTPPLQVMWYREDEHILDSDDFRILRKKASSAPVPEELCTLVITEAFPEDSGLFNIQSVQKKTSTMSLTISSSSSSSSSAAVSSRELSSSSSHCSSSSSGFLNQRHSNLLQTLPVGSETAQTPLSGQPYSANGVAPTFVKCLHDVSTLKGQLVVLECRMRGTPPLQKPALRQYQELCTLVITEAFPEDSGLFKCMAVNPFDVEEQLESELALGQDKEAAFLPPPPPDWPDNSDAEDGSTPNVVE
ncbi:hypothetical protein CRUP_024937 [Coryphaenoides rupestris]|nr:hypothetical protein CRUP_024937 [Coryphaenoides rupestris]